MTNAPTYPPPEITDPISGNQQLLDNIRAWGARQRLLGRTDLMAELKALWKATEPTAETTTALLNAAVEGHILRETMKEE